MQGCVLFKEGNYEGALHKFQDAITALGTWAPRTKKNLLRRFRRHELGRRELRRLQLARRELTHVNCVDANLRRLQRREMLHTMRPATRQLPRCEFFENCENFDVANWGAVNCDATNCDDAMPRSATREM